jgi:hypothetical protein
VVATASAATYSAVREVGKTRGGVLRFPKAVAYDDSGRRRPRRGRRPARNVDVADQYSFLV